MNNIYLKIFSSGAVKSVDIIVVFALTKILTQHLDQQSYSLYVIIENILLIVNVVLLLGYDRYLIRETSLLSKWGKVIANKYQKARINIFDLGLKIAPLVLLIICTLLWDNNLPTLILYIAILTVAIFTRAFTAINVAKLLGRNHIWQGNLLKETMAKAVFFFIVLILGFNYDLSLLRVLMIYAVSRIFSFYASRCYLSLYWPKENFQSVMQDFKLNRFDYSNVQLSFFRIQVLNYCFKYSGAIVLLIVGKSILSGHFDVIQKLSQLLIKQ